MNERVLFVWKQDRIDQHLTHVNDKDENRRRHLPIEKRRRRPARQGDDGDEKGHRRGEDQPPEKFTPRALFHHIPELNTDWTRMKRILRIERFQSVKSVLSVKIRV